MNDDRIRELLLLAVKTSFKAGEAILLVYYSDFKVQYKSDKSPVTLADQHANAVIEKLLAPSGIPALTEEGDEFSFEERQKHELIWIVDPLDGTKEFVKRNGEFTVNIALAEKGKPVIGVIFCPVSRDLYYAAEGIGSFRMDKHKVIGLLNGHANFDLNFLIEESSRLPLGRERKKYTVVASRSHLSSDLFHYLESVKREKGELELINTGSSIKMCLVAEGSADEYPRFGDTMEWDTCAGQCIVEQAGGSLVEWETGKPVRYNREQLKNKSFIAKNPA
jgi:3'(2'), 5'-bisphosphate nucleotidase